jgi:hypothetical protein
MNYKSDFKDHFSDISFPAESELFARPRWKRNRSR